jgi:hypothetical protein
MRYIITILIITIISLSDAGAQIFLTTADEITLSGRCLDSSGFHCTPDSVRIVVYLDGIEQHDAWYNAADAQCSQINNMLVFTDAFGDIDNDAGDGLYEVMAGYFVDDGDLYNWKTLWVYLGVDMAADQGLNKAAAPFGYREYGIGDTAYQYLSISGDVNGNVDSIKLYRYFWQDTMAVLIDSTSWSAAAGNVSGDPIQYLGEPETYLYTQRADFAGKSGFYNLSWILTEDSASARGGAMYKVNAPEDVDIAAAISKLENKFHNGMHWSPMGGLFGGDHLLSALSGEGSHLCSLYVLTTDSTAVSKCDIKVFNSGMNAVEALLYTSSQGLAIFGLMNGGYKISPFKTGYTFDGIPYDLAIDGSSLTDTIWAEAFDPGSPPSAELCRVYGWVFGAGYDSLMGVTVQARIKKSPIRYGSVVISPYEKITATDSTGYWYLDLLPNSTITPEGTEYQFSIYYSSGTVVRKEVTVPDTSSWEFGW